MGEDILSRASAESGGILMALPLTSVGMTSTPTHMNAASCSDTLDGKQQLLGEVSWLGLHLPPAYFFFRKVWEQHNTAGDARMGQT